MTAGWTPRRFWTEARAEPAEGGFTVLLDGRPVRTPARAALVVPSRAMADAIAAEWQAQGATVDPATMPMARYAHSAIDTVAPQFDAVAARVAAYGGSDLLCYRAGAPAALAARQAAAWDPPLAWARQSMGAALVVTTGVMPVRQPDDAVGRLEAQVRAMAPFALAALHDLFAITGSLVLGLAVTRGRLTAESAWAISRIDETWQAELWGADEEAAQAEAVRHAGLLDAARFLALCR